MAWIPKGYEQITALSSAQSLTVPSGARVARIQAQDQDIRWRDDGTAPTATVGMVLKAAGGGAEEMWYTGVLEDLQFIETAASAVLNVSYYG